MLRLPLFSLFLLFVGLGWPSGPAAGQGKQKKKRGRPGEIITPAAKGERLRDTLQVGDAAPDFTLRKLGAVGEKATLATFKGRKPVVLVFGSYT